jgi:triphosphatase
MSAAYDSGSREVELKFRCAPESLDLVLAAAPAGVDETRQLSSVYFDTPDLILQKAGASLRLRDGGGGRVQTLKRGSGLSREEHEAPVAADRPDPDLGPLRELLPNGAALSLEPVSEVTVTRRQRLIRYEGAEIELALDHGQVRAGGAAAPISEVELELKSGPPAALFRLARELDRAAPLYLSFDGKASRGQALAEGDPPAPSRKSRVTLPVDATSADAFQAVGRSALAQIAANAALLRDADGSEAAEAVHQLRVAIRRLRSAISTFTPLLDAEAARLQDELKWLARACDAARNLDALTERLPDKGPGEAVARLAQAIAEAGRHASQQASGAAASDRFRVLMIELAAWIETGAWLTDVALAAPREQPAEEFAAEALSRRWRKLRRRAADLEDGSDEARHAARIAAKKLRYAAETFASLFPPKPTRKFVGALKDLQDELGALNDAATAAAVLPGLSLDPEAAAAAEELARKDAARKPRRIRAAVRAFHRLEAATRFWR